MQKAQPEKLNMKASCTAYVLNEQRAWQQIGGGRASVALYEGWKGAGTFRLIGRSSDGSTWMNSPVHPNAKFVQSSPTFWYWADGKQCWGLNLLVELYANQFSQRVKEALAKVQMAYTANPSAQPNAGPVVDLMKISIVPSLRPPPLSARMFKKYDKDRSGTLDPSEFRLLAMDAGVHMTDKELEMALKLVDVNGDGQVDYDEFVGWWTSTNRWDDIVLTEEHMQKMEHAAEIFRKFDADFSGTIEANEWPPMHAELLAKGVTKNQNAQRLLQELDRDGSGDISFAEFADWIVRKTAE